METIAESSRVLVVDDEPQITRVLRTVLVSQGYEVRTAAEGESAFSEFRDWAPELVITDLVMPHMDGIQLCRRIREVSNVPIIVLSVKGEERSKVDALDSGADDYVTKPFGMDELLARLRAALRRAAPIQEAPVIDTPDFRIDLNDKRIVSATGEVRLTPIEWHLVEVLARNAGKLVTARQLLEEVWGPAYEKETNYLRVHFAHIRRKLEPEPSQPRYFITEPGMGYRFESNSAR